MPRPSHLAAAAALVALGAASAAFANPVVRYPGSTTIHRASRPVYPGVRHRHRTEPAGWSTLTANSPFGPNGAGTPELMTDGTVMVQDNSSAWWRLVPDVTGDYVNGTWVQAASLPSGYGPLYFSSAVLPDGKLVVNGGEYNFGHGDWTTLGAIYDPVANAWTSVTAPSGWTTIGDAQNSILPNGTYMLANCCTTQAALFGEGSLGWTSTGTGKADINDEEGWTLLPTGNVLTVDVSNSVPRQSEMYNPTTGAWTSAGTLPNDLVNHQYGEIGPAVLRPNDTVFATGATGATDIYNVKTGVWKAGPNIPSVTEMDKHGRTKVQQDIADGTASLLADGHVLFGASPGVYQAPTHFYEFTGRKYKRQPDAANAPENPSYAYRMLMLPTGQVLVTDGSDTVQVFTSLGKAVTGIGPTVSSVPSTLTHGDTYQVSGTKFNGYSQDSMYGDDAQMATNYPLVRITNDSSGDVVYAKTHGHSTMAVATGSMPTSTNFDVPASIEVGASMLEVVANGIASKPVAVMIQ